MVGGSNYNDFSIHSLGCMPRISAKIPVGSRCGEAITQVGIGITA